VGFLNRYSSSAVAASCLLFAFRGVRSTQGRRAQRVSGSERRPAASQRRWGLSD